MWSNVCSRLLLWSNKTSDFSAQSATNAAVEGRRLTGDVHDHSAGFGNDRRPSGHVPAVDAHVVVSIS